MRDDIITPRLDLLRISHDELFAVETIPPETDPFLHRTFSNPHDILTGETIPHANRIADVRATPEHIKWYYRLIVCRADNVLIGSTSFHAAPDDDGMLEIGLGITPTYTGNGFATEAVMGMWDWAVQQPDVVTLRYTVSPENLASQAIIAKFPAQHMGQQIDEEDGPEDIYEISAQTWREFRATN